MYLTNTYDNFWLSLPQNFFVLAPMEEVTDTVFRKIILSVSDLKVLRVVFTEFTSVDGICNAVGKDLVARRLKIITPEQLLLHKNQTKIVAQIWGSDPEKFYKAVKIIQADYPWFSGIDINMGCPVKKVVKSKSCSALIKYPSLAKEIICAAKEAATIPVSVKTRIGFTSIQTNNWIGHLLETPVSAITIHGRTQKQQSSGLANWDEIKSAVALRDTINTTIKIIGNGDILSINDGIAKAAFSKADGLMVGRGVFLDPWIFNKNKLENTEHERINLLLEHIRLFEQTWNSSKNYNTLKRFFKIYIHGFTGASALRTKLMATTNSEQVFELFESEYATLSDLKTTI